MARRAGGMVIPKGDQAALTGDASRGFSFVGAV